jgi:hypothetical protein
MIVMAMAVAIAGCGGGKGSSPSEPETKSSPAEIISSPPSFLGSESVRPISNGWRTSNTRRFTQVEAGALPSDHSIGALAIFRYSFKTASQDANLVKVIGSGALKITHAPTGAGVESTAQRNGKIEFSSENGARGRLDLRNDSIHLDVKPWKPPG